MNFLIQIAWSILFSLVARALAPTNKPPAPEKQGISDVDVPAIDEGQTVPIYAGTVKLDGQNVSWFGGLSAKPVSQQGVVTGYKYSLTVQLTFGFGPIEGIKEIRFEDNALTADQYTIAETADYFDVTINAPKLFGGDDKEGGVAGVLRVYKGTTTQTHDTETATLVGKVVPAYRRVCYAVARNFYWGLSARLKPLSIVVQRWPNPLSVTTHKIGEDANPICFLFEVLTDAAWGAGEPIDRFELDDWRAAAAQVHAEGLGISLRFAQAASVEDMMKALLKYVDGNVYEDPVTGKYSIRLIRDMVGADFPVLDKLHVTSVNASRISWSELKNTVKVTFTDRARNYETGGVQAQQSAALATVGNIIDLESLDLPGFHKPEAAAFVAQRTLRALSYPLSKVQIKGDRALATLRPGFGFRLVWERPTLSAVYRVTSINFGSLDSPEVTVEAIEDAFSTSANTFVVPARSTWAPTAAEARPPSQEFAVETPYHLARSDTRSVIYGAARPGTQALDYSLVVDGTPAATTYAFTPSGTLTGAMPLDVADTSITLAITLPDALQPPTQAQYDAGQALLLIDNELLGYRYFTRNGDGTVTFAPVVRAVADTVPTGHADGATVWLLDDTAARLPLALAADRAVTVGALTTTASDVMTPGEQSTVTITTNSRALRPYPPADMRVNGQVLPGTLSAPFSVTWKHRSRTATALVGQEGTTTPEAGTTYIVKVYNDATGALLGTQSVTGTSATVTDTAVRVRVSVAAVRDGLESTQAATTSFETQAAVEIGETKILMHFDGAEGATTTSDTQGNTVQSLAALGIDDGGALRAAGAKLGPTGASGGWAVQVPATAVVAAGDWMAEGWFISSAAEPAVLLSGLGDYAVATTGTGLSLISLVDFSELATAPTHPYGTQVHVLLQRRGSAVSVAVGGVQVMSVTDSAELSAVAWYVNIATTALTAGTATNPSPNYVDEFRLSVGGSRALPFTP